MNSSTPLHVQNFRQNIAEVQGLLDIHVQVSGDAPGRRSGVEVLNKSGIVLLVACWEAYVEDLAIAAFDFMLANATTHTVFPDGVLTLASSNLKKSQDDRVVWGLAGDGWINILQNHKQKTVEKYVANFNTPRAKNIDDLFANLIGLTQLSSNWSWSHMTVENAQQKLSDLIILRGSIAHRVATSQKIYKGTVTDYGTTVNRLAVISSNQVREYIHLRTSHFPWIEYKL